MTETTERVPTREQLLPTFDRVVPADPYAVENVLAHVRMVLGYPVQMHPRATRNGEHPPPEGALVVSTDTPATRAQMDALLGAFATQPVAGTLQAIATGQWRNLTVSALSPVAAQEAYGQPEITEDTLDALMGLGERGLWTALRRAQEQGEAFDHYGTHLLAVLGSRPTPILPLTPEDLGGIAMGTMRTLLTAHPEWQPRPTPRSGRP